MAADGSSLKVAVPAHLAGVEIASPFVSVGAAPEPPATSILALDNPAGLYASTFLGGSDGDYGKDVAVDANGHVYVTGYTYSANFPTTPGAFDRSLGGGDAFVVKMNAGLSALIYATFVGGINGEQGRSIAVDGTGAAYVAGYTDSSNFPTTPGAYDRSYNGFNDVFVLKLNPLGSALVYSTFVGGNFEEEGYGIAVDGAGAAYVTGWSCSSDFPTTPGAFRRIRNGSTDDAFVVKMNPAGSGLAYGTYLGGSEVDHGQGIAVGSGGVAYVTGWTRSANFPTTAGAYDRVFNGGSEDAFVVKMNPAGSALAYGTYLGGSDDERGYGIAVDTAGSAYVTGHTESASFPTTAGAFDRSYNGSYDHPYDGFVAKLNATGSALTYSTFLGGGHNDGGTGIAVLPSGLAYVVGGTQSSDFPTTVGAVDRTHNGDVDTFVVKMGATGSGLAYSTLLGGSAEDPGLAIVVSAGGSAVVIGETKSSNFPTTVGARDRTYNGSRDAFVAKLAMKPVYLQRVNAGGGAYQDAAGNWWAADRPFAAGTWGYVGAATGTFTTTQPIAGTSADPLYQSERNGMSEYRFSVPNGTYTVTLRFSENVLAGAGQRVFDVKAEGTAKLVNLDIFAAAGNARFKAVDRTFTVAVSDGVLNLEFVAKVRKPKVGAIMVQSK